MLKETPILEPFPNGRNHLTGRKIWRTSMLSQSSISVKGLEERTERKEKKSPNTTHIDHVLAYVKRYISRILKIFTRDIHLIRGGPRCVECVAHATY